MRSNETDLNEWLTSSPERFHFFQAVRLLQNWLLCKPGESPLGVVCDDPSQEQIRFISSASKAFPVSQIVELDQVNGSAADHKLLQIEISFLGLFGSLGALPWHDTQRAISQPLFRRFLDIFNHRLTALFYRAWEKNHFYIGYEKSLNGTGQATSKLDLMQVLLSAIGLGEPSLRSRLATCEDSLVRHLMLLSGKHRSSMGLKSVLSCFFPGYAVVVYEFQKTLLKLEPNNATSLARQPKPNNALGLGTILGDLVPDYQSKFRIRIGPVGFSDFRRFLPNTPRFKELVRIVKFVVGISLDFDLQFEVDKSDIPPARLSTDADGSQLGQSTWIASVPFETNRLDPVFST